MSDVDVKPSMLKWARIRAGRDGYFKKNFPEIKSWERGKKSPSLGDVMKFAKAAYVPIGYLFLDKPPNVRLPVSDFRTVGSADASLPSPNLLDTVYLCQQRQEWYREEVKSNGAARLDFVGSMNTNDAVESSAEKIRDALKLGDKPQPQKGSRYQLRQHLIDALESLGVLVMISGVVGNNNHRKLDVDEFRGFALADPWAPLIFVNGKDGRGAQIFTLAHETAHIWLGQSAVSGNTMRDAPNHVVEKWCNAVAAEILVPAETIRKEYVLSSDPSDEISRLADLFKVSTQVIIRRIYDIEMFDKTTFQKKYDREVQLAVEREKEKKAKGDTFGNYYNTVPVRSSKKFTRAILASTMEGKTPPIVSRRLLDVWNPESIAKLSQKLGVGR